MKRPLSRPVVSSNKTLNTDFARHVFAIVAKIPKGRTMTYGQVAEAAGRPGASRAVGNILSTNWDPEIPCHRVIRADGKMGGYNRGTERKKEILTDERRGVVQASVRLAHQSKNFIR